MVEGVASFYSFLSLTPKGRNTIRLCGNIVDRFSRLDSVQAAFVAELGIKMGQASHDRVFHLGQTPCTDLCDQAVHNLDITYKWFSTCTVNDETVTDNKSRWVCHGSF